MNLTKVTHGAITRAQLVAALRKTSGWKAPHCAYALNKFCALIAQALMQGRPVHLTRLGWFTFRLMGGGKIVRNPAHPERGEIVMPPHWKLIFHPSREIRDKLKKMKTPDHYGKVRRISRSERAKLAEKSP